MSNIRLLRTRQLLLFLFISLLSSSVYANGNGDSGNGDIENNRTGSLENSGTGYPMDIQDGTGYSFTIDSRPDNVVSVALFSDEVLPSLIDKERISALSSISLRSEYSNVSDSVDGIEKFVNLNVEVLLQLNPDLIIAADWSNSAKIRQLRSLGIDVYRVRTPSSIKEIKKSIAQLGIILDAEKSSREIIEKMEAVLSGVERNVKEIPESGKFTVIDYSAYNTSGGNSSTWNEIVTAAGLKNGVSTFRADKYGQVAISREQILKINPDIIFVPGYVHGKTDGGKELRNSVISDPAMTQINAVKNRRIYVIPERLKSTYSQYIADAVKYTAEKSYPDYF